jgi:hypothetical protein
MFTAVLMLAMVSGAEVADRGCCGGCRGSHGGCGGCMGCCGGCYGCCGGCDGGYGIAAGVGGYGAGIGISGGYGADIDIGGGDGAGIGIGGVVAPTTTVPATTTPAQTQQPSEVEAPATILDNVPAEAKGTAGVMTTQSLYYNPGNATEQRARITVHLLEKAQLYVDDVLSQKKSSTRPRPPIGAGQPPRAGATGVADALAGNRGAVARPGPGSIT